MNLPRIILPWTKTTELSANSRLHWARKSALIKSQKATAHALALEAGWHKLHVPDGAIVHLHLTYCPPSRGGIPDDDNVITAHKGARDALADVLRIDDRRMRCTAELGERCKNGGVIVDARIEPNSRPAHGDNFTRLEGPAEDAAVALVNHISRWRAGA